MGNLSGPIVIQMRKGNLIFRPDRMPENDLANIIELVPILVEVSQVSI